MTGYSLSFFATGRYDKEWWDTLTPEKARAAADRARKAGCEPNDLAEIRCGEAVAWVGPSVGEVLAKLKV